jgi:fructosamine-3-kinase
VQGFRKEGVPGRADAFAAEADGLEALRPHVRVPRVLDHGVKNGKAFILLEQLELRRSGDWAAMGRMLANLHRQHGERFGWHRDNHIGLSPQFNAWTVGWREFFAEQRLKPQAEMARKNGFAVDIRGVTKILENHEPKPSLLHGDLWAGNAGFIEEGPVLFDPAVYYGDREADLAMTELFGGFPAEFYASYDKEYPLDAGYEKRKHLYNLYHLLNHLNIFGRGYLSQVAETIELLRR